MCIQYTCVVYVYNIQYSVTKQSYVRTCNYKTLLSHKFVTEQSLKISEWLKTLPNLLLQSLSQKTKPLQR